MTALNPNHGESRFLRLHEGTEGRFQMIRCRCGATARVRDATTRTWLPAEVMSKKFQQLGWKVGQRPSKDICPTCARDGRRSRTHLKLVVDAPTPLEGLLSSISRAEPPRGPTVAERRAIVDALEMSYDIRAERYLGSESDDGIVKALGDPYVRAWVAEVRIALFGAHDRCEVDAATLGEIKSLRAEITAAKTHLSVLDQRLSALERT